MTTVLVCPKCHAAMRTYERSGISVDQCTDCRGIFLDRGELDRLLDAETVDAREAVDERGDRGGRALPVDDHDESRRDRDESRRDHDESRRDHDAYDPRREGGRGEYDPRSHGRRRESRFGTLLDLFGGEE